MASQQDATKRAAAVAASATSAEFGAVVVIAAAPMALGVHLGGREDVAVGAWFASASAMTRPRLMMAHPRRFDIFAVAARHVYWQAEPPPAAAGSTELVEAVGRGRRRVAQKALATRSQTAHQVMLATPKSQLLAVIGSRETSHFVNIVKRDFGSPQDMRTQTQQRSKHSVTLQTLRRRDQ